VHSWVDCGVLPDGGVEHGSVMKAAEIPWEATDPKKLLAGPNSPALAFNGVRTSLKKGSH
jgi:hypothetical protein